MSRTLLKLNCVVALLFILSAFCNGLLLAQQYFITKGVEEKTAKINEKAQLQALLTVIPNLVYELTQYAQKQPAIVPVLQKNGINPQIAPPAPTTQTPAKKGK